MASDSSMSTILGLGILGVGAYFFFTEVWPSMKMPTIAPPPAAEEKEIVRPILEIEDEYPDVVVEDRYPDIIYEDRYPDIVYQPEYIPYPVPVYPTPTCSRGKYWDGEKCRKIDCPPGWEWDDGECKIDCPPGFRRKDNRCIPREVECDDDEYWDGSRCRNIPIECPPGTRLRDGRCRPIEVTCRRGYYNDHGVCKKREEPTTERRFNRTSRDRWHEDRDAEDRVRRDTDRIRQLVSPETAARITPIAEAAGEVETTAASDRQQEIVEKAVQSFLQVWYA